MSELQYSKKKKYELFSVGKMKKLKKSDMVPEHLQAPANRAIRKEVTRSTMANFFNIYAVFQGQYLILATLSKLILCT